MDAGASSSRKRLIAYDLDGTLVDTAEDITGAVNAMLGQLSASPLSKDEIRQCVGRGLHDLIGRCLNTNEPERIRNGLDAFEAHYAAHLVDHSVLYPGVLEVLDYFQDRRQAVFTNKPNPFARDLLVALGVAERFCAILAGADGHPRKPDPMALHELMRSQGVGAGETLLVGDSVIDVETGRNAGVLTVIVAQGFEDPQALQAASPDLLVTHFAQLLQVAKRHGW